MKKTIAVIGEGITEKHYIESLKGLSPFDIKPKELIQKEIEHAYYNYGISTFLFVDDTFNDSIDKMEMVKRIRQDSKIPFEFADHLMRARQNLTSYDIIFLNSW